jgi:hypothetical protein
MSINILAFTIATLSVFTGTSPDSGTKPVDNKHFLIYGEIVEVDLIASKEVDGTGTQVVVYQDDEIYVAFNADETGKYKFNLPINHNYRVVYGGKDFVNKEILINAHELPKKKYGHNVKLDLGMFKNFDGVDYSFLAEPVALIAYDDIMGKLSFDEKYSKKQSKAMFKCMKQIVKMHG